MAPCNESKSTAVTKPELSFLFNVQRTSIRLLVALATFFLGVVVTVVWLGLQTSGLPLDESKGEIY